MRTLTQIVEGANPVFAADLFRPSRSSVKASAQVADPVFAGNVVDVSSKGKFGQLLEQSSAIPATLATASALQEQNTKVVDPSRFLMVDGQSTFFKNLQLSQMSRPELSSLLDARKAYKEQLFSAATKAAEANPAIANVNSCASSRDAVEGLCAITPAQRDELRMQATARSLGGLSTGVPIPAITHKRALVIGLNKYTDKRIPQLVSASYDARSVGEAFSAQLGYEVTLLQNPSKAEIVSWFNRIIVEMNDTNSFVVYFAGHGELVEKTQLGYWIPGDAVADDPSTWISNTDISRWLANVNSKQVTVIADSCYSGSLVRDVETLGVGLGATLADDYLAKRSITVMTSGSDEPVSDTGKFGHSVFAWNLLEEIKNLKSWTAGASVFTKVRVQVERELPQTPMYGIAAGAGHEAGGDFLFERRSKIK